MITIRDHFHAAALVAEGQTSAADIGDSQSAIMFRDALEERLAGLGDCTTCDAIAEGRWLASQIEALDCDWGDAPSPECESHLY